MNYTKMTVREVKYHLFRAECRLRTAKSRFTRAFCIGTVWCMTEFYINRIDEEQYLIARLSNILRFKEQLK